MVWAIATMRGPQSQFNCTNLIRLNQSHIEWNREVTSYYNRMDLVGQYNEYVVSRTQSSESITSPAKDETNERREWEKKKKTIVISHLINH